MLGSGVKQTLLTTPPPLLLLLLAAVTAALVPVSPSCTRVTRPSMPPKARLAPLPTAICLISCVLVAMAGCTEKVSSSFRVGSVTSLTEPSTAMTARCGASSLVSSIAPEDSRSSNLTAEFCTVTSARELRIV
eukprot:17204-Heterococcus_DN1.PRE.3